jgi:ferritin-like protein
MAATEHIRHNEKAVRSCRVRIRNTYCAGMHLARMEITAHLNAMLDRIASFEVGVPKIVEKIRDPADDGARPLIPAY